MITVHNGICSVCGREYSDYAEGLCPSDDCPSHEITYRQYLELKCKILEQLSQRVFDARIDQFYRSNVVNNARLANQQGKPWTYVNYQLMPRITTLELCLDRVTRLYLEHPAGE